MRKVLSIVAAGWFLITIASAAVYSPRVVSPHHADVYSLRTFAEFPRWRDLSGDEKVFAIYRYLIDERTGIYPMGVPAREGEDEWTEFSAVTDPVKMLNVYPIGHCGTLGPTMAAIMEGMGIGPARTLIIPRWHHVASEVFYDRTWHYVDLDVRAVFRRADGSLASMAEAQRDSSLWEQPNRAWFFPLDPIDEVRAVYAVTAVEHRYGVAAGGHTMDFVLRQGESLIRWWHPQGGRWNHHSSYAAAPFPRDLLTREPRGPKCKHPSFTRHAHGNGLFVYRPNLTLRSSDFADGIYDARHVRPTDSGLKLDGANSGYAIFEVRSPYVIVPLVGDLDSPEDDREASVIRIDGDAIALSISRDNGATWRRLKVINRVVDVTPWVKGSYGYLLRIELASAEAIVRSLELKTWVQVHPASLPSLRAGQNRMQLVTGDHYGLQTRVVELRPDAAKLEELLPHLIQRPVDYDANRRSSRIRGPMTVKLDAPPGTRIAWFSAGGSFTTHQRNAAPQTRNAMAYATDGSSEFTGFYRASVPADQSHWHYNTDREVKLAQPARTIAIRYVGDPGLNNIRIYAHCLEDEPRAFQPIEITHVWTENGARKQFRRRLDSPGAYMIEAVADPVDQSIELSVPSRLR